MDGVIALLIAVAGWLAFGLFATHGVDSRETAPDDHQRRQASPGGLL